MRGIRGLCGLALAVVLAVAPGAVVNAAPVVDTPTIPPAARQQLEWVIDATGRAPVPAEEQGRHLAAGFLAAIGGSDEFNRVLTSVGRLTADVVRAGVDGQVEALTTGTAGRLLVTVHVDASGLIDLLVFSPYVDSPRTWSEVDARLRALAPRASFVSAVVDRHGRCRVVHGVDAGTQRPLGSAFKLYVLGALAHAVAQGRAAWDERLAIRDEWKSLPSGQLQNVPAGTELTLREYAEAMIAISDNTATDHLIHRLGRGAVQAQLFRFGNQRPGANIPFLTTRNMFVLKGHRYPAAADAYLALPRARRAAALAATERVPLPEIQPWQEPRRIDELEWFGSPTDMCRAFAGLARQAARPALAPVRAALSLNSGGIGLDRTVYPTVWFKGGSEPGVLTINYLARTAGGETVVSSVMLSNPVAPLDEAAISAEAIAVARASIELATAR